MPVAIISSRGKRSRIPGYFDWNPALLGCNLTSLFSEDIAAICPLVNVWKAYSTFTMKHLIYILMVSMEVRRTLFVNARIYLIGLQIPELLEQELSKKEFHGVRRLRSSASFQYGSSFSLIIKPLLTSNTAYMLNVKIHAHEY